MMQYTTLISGHNYYEKHVAINISMHVHMYNVHGTVSLLHNHSTVLYVSGLVYIHAYDVK